MSNGYLVGVAFWGFQMLMGMDREPDTESGNRNLAGASTLAFTCYGFSSGC